MDSSRAMRRLRRRWQYLPGWFKGVLAGYLVMGLLTGVASGYTSDWGCEVEPINPLGVKVVVGALAGMLWPLTVQGTLEQLHDGPARDRNL